ncbi:hypothetical protein EVAR_11875_1 [Eumeta japonica]|uniref:Uncharacterized protein n=1 Tax=Eumeta variegata TaxID=151549 RepID=A0A4C1U7Q6_EUMVA|nr:hypothetical protein EVAR_11875_1 [Eumeta japonica]
MIWNRARNKLESDLKGKREYDVVPPLMVSRNFIGVTSSLLTSWIGIRCLMKRSGVRERGAGIWRRRWGKEKKWATKTLIYCTKCTAEALTTLLRSVRVSNLAESAHFCAAAKLTTAWLYHYM